MMVTTFCSEDAEEDYMNGDKGNDRIYGDLGDDVLEGGQGADYFDCGEGYDVITDFKKVEKDVAQNNCEEIRTNV